MDTMAMSNGAYLNQGVPEMTHAEYQKLAKLIYSVSGIALKESKQALLNSRLGGMLAQSGRKSFSEYYDILVSDKSGALVAALVDRVTTNHTYFMRESAHFNYFKATVLPYLKQTVADRDLRTWCAACSSGEEAYTLAMLMDEFFELEKARWDCKILATDLSDKVLKEAISGVYSADRIQPLPAMWKQRYFKHRGDDQFEVQDWLKKEVIYRRFNLIDKVYPFKRKFHVIFCRNVMIYFDAATRNQIIDKFYEITEPGGYLFIGHSESVDRSKSAYKYVMPAVYRKM